MSDLRAVYNTEVHTVQACYTTSPHICCDLLRITTESVQRLVVLKVLWREMKEQKRGAAWRGERQGQALVSPHSWLPPQSTASEPLCRTRTRREKSEVGTVVYAFPAAPEKGDPIFRDNVRPISLIDCFWGKRKSSKFVLDFSLFTNSQYFCLILFQYRHNNNNSEN